MRGEKRGGDGGDGECQAGERPGAARPAQEHLGIDMRAMSQARRLIRGQIGREVTWRRVDGDERAWLPPVLVLGLPLGLPLGLLVLFPWHTRDRRHSGKRAAHLGEGTGRGTAALAHAVIAVVAIWLPAKCRLPTAGLITQATSARAVALTGAGGCRR